MSSSISEEETKRKVIEAFKNQINSGKAVEAQKEPEVPVLAEEAKPAELKSNQKWFSDVFKYKPYMGDFPVTIFNAKDWSENVRVFIPEKDPTYEPQKIEVAKIVLALEHNDKTIITGPTGAGKSSVVRYICSVLGRPLIRLNMKGDIESSSVFGSVGARDGSTVWTDGPATEAVKYGAVLLVDEWDVTPPEIMFGFQYLLERNGKLYVAEMPGTSEDRMLTPNENFRIICCGNTVGQGDDTGHFAGTTPQNTATLDRFDTSIRLGYLNKDHELKILKNNVPSINKPTMEKMIQLAALVRDGYTSSRIGLTLSPRSLIGWAYKIEQYNGDVREAFKVSYADKLRESDQKVVFELYTKVFGK